MKFVTLALLFAAFVVTTSGSPLGTGNEGSTSVDGRILPFIGRRIKEHRKRLFQIGENIISTSKQAVSGLGSIVKGDLQGPFLCTGCKAAVEALRFQVKSGREEDIYPMIESTCILLNIQTKPVCSGIAYLFGPELVPILNTTIDALYICSFLLTHDCTKVDLPQWETTLPPFPVRDAASEPSPPPADGPKLKVLHLSDTHYDRSYTEGAKVECGEPLCCRAQNGLASRREKGAGKWGDWNCDIPERTLDNMLEHASQTHPDIDYVIWTGDIPAHDIWNQSKEANLGILHTTVEKVKRYFPRTPVFPAVGNHESAPTDNFPQPDALKSPSWLYDELNREWSYWLPNSTSETVRRGAFYTTLIRPGFRIVSLNTNYCYHRNWWLIINSTDPAGQLEWLVEVLHRAEEQNEKVHIIAHIPPGQTDCLPTWRDNYYRIVSRFKDTIVNHFYGHTHKDEFEIYYNHAEETEPVGVGYIGPSVTTYTSLNPGYRIYYVDGDREGSSRAVLDFENWILDLEHANKNDDPKWNKSYTAKEEYGMSSLSPRDWDDFYKRMKTDDQLFQLYYKHSNKDSPQVNPRSCDANCKRAVFCGIRSCHKYD